MKKFVIVFSILAFTAIPFRPAQANLTDVEIRRFVVLSTAAACAINIQVLNIIGNQLNGNEALLLNGNFFAAFTALIIAQGLAAGQFVLFASPSFEAEAEITADVPITDQQCEDLQEGDEFTFQGSEGTIVSAQALIIVTLAVLTAIVLNTATSEFGVFALAQFFLTINSLVASVTVGNVDGKNAESDGGDGGGCSLQPKSETSKGLAWLLAMMAPLAGATLWRRRLV